MNFSIAATISRWLAPRRELSCSLLFWRRLTRKLRERGRDETRESGAFLLGYVEPAGAARIVTSFCMTISIRKSRHRHRPLRWQVFRASSGRICRERKLTVVGDVHVHPGDSGQSRSDRAYPMVSQAGHLALILPRFARTPIPHEEIGIYRYLGGGEWHTVPRGQRHEFFIIGF